jgi:hypothetical protein
MEGFFGKRFKKLFRFTGCYNYAEHRQYNYNPYNNPDRFS